MSTGLTYLQQSCAFTETGALGGDRRFSSAKNGSYVVEY